MSSAVNWTTESKISFNENIEYLNREWDLTAINNFLDKIDSIIDLIEKNPTLYPLYRKSDHIHKMCNKQAHYLVL